MTDTGGPFPMDRAREWTQASRDPRRRLQRARQGQLIQVDPPGPTVTFHMNPESLTRSPRKPRFNTVDRPHRISATEWQGKSPFEISFDLLLDGYPEGDVSDQMSQLEGFMSVHPNIPPRRLRLRYSGFSPVLYVMSDLQWGQEIRREDLHVVRVTASISLREWISPDVVPSPAQSAREQPAPSPRSQQTHTVKEGDTLWDLAEQYLGAGERFPEIADLNDIRDPDVINVGQTLRIPER